MGVDEFRMIPELEYVQTPTNNEEAPEYAVAGVGGIIWFIDVLVCMVLILLFLLNIATLVFFVVITAVMSWELLRSYDTFNTGDEGLEVDGPLMHRFIKWSDVTEIRTTRFLYIIKSDTTSIRIPVSKGMQYLRLIASIWQHLVQVGKTDGLKLPKDVSGFWTAIPESIQNEAEWSNPHPMFILLRALCVPVAALLSGWLIYYGMSTSWDFVLQSLYYLLALVAIIVVLSRVFYVPYSVLLRNGVLRAVTILGVRELHVLDLRKVRWLYGRNLELCANDKKVIIPCRKLDLQTRTLLLVLIKSLRKNHGVTVMPVPSFLNELDLEAENSHSVTLSS